MSDANLEFLKKRNYLGMIGNSPGAKIFQNFYVRMRDTGEEKDILGGGDLSCAVFVSSILYLHNLISGPHAEVKSTVRDMTANGWLETDNPEQGDIVVWEKEDDNEHIGFWWSRAEAISNSSKEKIPLRHSIDFDGSRKISAIYHKDIK